MRAQLDLSPQQSSGTPFKSGNPFVNGAPGVDAARRPLGADRLPSPPRASSAADRLASVVARAPRVQGTSEKFLP